MFASATATMSSMLDSIVGVGDMVLLEPITEDNLIENLRKRLKAKSIYVRTQLHKKKKDEERNESKDGWEGRRAEGTLV